MISFGTFSFDLALPFEAGGMDASGFTVAPAAAPCKEQIEACETPSGRAAFDLSGCLATFFWMAASALAF
jgi:hypothetical protein